MCTAISMLRAGHLFGRTLDLEVSLGEQVVITPAGFSFGGFSTKYSMIGAAIVRDGAPLYFDGMNEKGLCAAALNYPDHAFYGKEKSGMLNTPSFALLPFILGRCQSAEEARELLKEINVTDTLFSDSLKPTPLHWLIADKDLALCAEPDMGGLTVYDDPYRVLTNSPPFPHQRLRLCDYMALSPKPPENELCPKAPLSPYSRGLGAMGLPGDYSSTSRFIRAVFALWHTRSEGEPISDFFHIMDSVAVPSGTVIAENGKAVRSIYTCCADANDLTYYYTTYGCRAIHGVKLTSKPKNLTCFPMSGTENISFIDSLCDE